MTNLHIVYFSGSGQMAKMGEGIFKGARYVAGTQVHILPIRDEDIENGRFKNDLLMASLDSSDAVILGSPAYMGGATGQSKCFADVTGERWFKSAWRDKLAAGFTVSGGPSGEQLRTLHYFFALAMENGMVWLERRAARLRAAAAHSYPGSLGKTRLTKTKLWQTRT